MHFICIDRHLKTSYDVCVTAPHLVYNGKQQHITSVMLSSTQNMFGWPLLFFLILLFLLTIGLCVLLWLTAYWNSFSIIKPFVECHLTILGLSYMKVPLNIHSPCAHRYLKLSNLGDEYVGRNNQTTKWSRKWRSQQLLKTIMV